MTLYEEWAAKSQGDAAQPAEKFWKDYLPREQKIYEHLLENKKNSIKTTVAGLACAHNLAEFEAVGFLDGISGALDEEHSFEDALGGTPVNISFNFEALFKKMVEYKAKHLYSLPQWENIFDLDTRKQLMREQQQSGTVIRDRKVSRNDPCPCGSGKKYKKCCGMND